MDNFELTQVWIVEEPLGTNCLMVSQDKKTIDKYDKHIKLLENHMNEQDVLDIRDVIEDVMTKYLFELADDKTMNAIKHEIASVIQVEDFYDYLLEATVNQDSVVIDLCIKPTDSENFKHFTASYTNTPAIQMTDKVCKESFNDFDSAMKVI